MEPLHVGFLWHHHQPFYKNLVTGKYLLPWVRLHAIKDYIGLLLVLREFPDIRMTINLVPSLLVQIEEYAAGRAVDDALRLTRKPADELNEADRRYVLEHFFACNPERLIKPFPRYHELYERCCAMDPTSREAHEVLSPDVLRDIQVWATLAWFHPLVVAEDDVLRGLREKGRDFTEEEKLAMLARQDEVIGRVIPLHREMAQAGRIELTTTPFYHPIMPLLIEMESARMGLPDLPMPERRSDMAQDADEQLRRAVEYHAGLFGEAPTGVWPAEGSVSADMAPLLAKHGVRWAATDEGILARSMDLCIQRDGEGNLLAPDDLCGLWRMPGEPDAPAILFRDHVLSDAIGFQYHHGDSVQGAEHLVARLRTIAERRTVGPGLLPIILDGENPWDCYEEAGVPFLRTLCARLLEEPGLTTTRISDFVEAHPPTRTLTRLHAGSWIDANFSIWIGMPEDRKAWSLLADAREATRRRFGEPGESDDPNAKLAWEEIYIAEGSDWYWWFGGDRSSEQDYLFDALFRAHLVNAYKHLGEPPPTDLEKPVGGPPRTAPLRLPRGRCRVTLDGRATSPEEWLAAGQYSAAREASAMLRADGMPLGEFYFGFTEDAFCIRMDGPVWERADRESLGVVLHIVRPLALRVELERLERDQPFLRVRDAEGRERAFPRMAAVNECLELALPLSHLAARPGDTIEFLLEVSQHGAPVQMIPREGTIEAPVPSDG